MEAPPAATAQTDGDDAQLFDELGITAHAQEQLEQSVIDQVCASSLSSCLHAAFCTAASRATHPRVLWRAAPSPTQALATAATANAAAAAAAANNADPTTAGE